MRFSISGICGSGKTIYVYEAGTLVLAHIWNAQTGGEEVNPILGNDDGVIFYVDDTLYPFPAFFDLKITEVSSPDTWIYGVWSSFFVDAPGVVADSGSPYTLGAMRSRLAIFYSLDKEDTQVKNVLDECIQTGYEKVVSVVNTHAQQNSFTITSIANEISYSNASMGIPTFVGYKSRRLIYLPYEELRAKYNNFESGWDIGDPVNFSLVGFNGVNKTLIVAPTPKEAGSPITVLCFQVPAPLVNDLDYPIVPADWAWLILERAKIERIRFEREFELYQIQGQEFVAYMKALINRSYPTIPQPETGFKASDEMINYQSWRSRRI